MRPGVASGQREGYVAALTGLWKRLAWALTELESIAADPSELYDEEGVLERLPPLQYALHAASELALGLRPPAGEHRHRGTSWRVLTWEPWRIDWWATAVQFVGTLFFNISTFAAVRGSTMSIAHQNHRIWMPDVLGSICFLVASALAWGEAGHRWWSWRPGSIGWRIAALNLVGSIAFGVSAVAAYVVPSDGELRNVALANLGTFVGAICFLVGGLLLLPERTAGPAVDDD